MKLLVKEHYDSNYGEAWLVDSYMDARNGLLCRITTYSSLEKSFYDSLIPPPMARF